MFSIVYGLYGKACPGLLRKIADRQAKGEGICKKDEKKLQRGRGKENPRRVSVLSKTQEDESASLCMSQAKR
jgi:hypothetical protein